MSTIDNKELIDKLIANNGYFEDDPQVYMIVEYTNAYDKITYGVTWVNENQIQRERYRRVFSHYVRQPKIIWCNFNHPLWEKKC